MLFMMCALPSKDKSHDFHTVSLDWSLFIMVSQNSLLFSVFPNGTPSTISGPADRVIPLKHIHLFSYLTSPLIINRFSLDPDTRSKSENIFKHGSMNILCFKNMSVSSTSWHNLISEQSPSALISKPFMPSRIVNFPANGAACIMYNNAETALPCLIPLL